MTRNKIKLKVGIVIAIFIFSSFPFLAFTVTAWPFKSNSDISVSTDFYNGIGQMYNAKTDDNLNIKVFRYHAPGGTFNDGAQPVLLFPGLAMNINVFLMHSTQAIKDRFDLELPDNLAAWAVGDKNIEEDPLLYYSIAYYLWKMGYDPWFANYRGIGYADMTSEGGDDETSMDHWALYDVKAAVKKVNEITGLHPAIGGHSTGGLVSMMYLQGTTFRWDGHVRSYDDLVRERNGITQGPQTVEGFIGIDPAAIPVLPDLMDSALIWALLSMDLVIDAGGLISTLTDIDLVDSLLQGMLSLILDEDLLGETITDFLKNTGNLDITNVNDVIMYYFFMYGVSKLYFRALSQYLDYYVNQCVREFWKNGWFNDWRLEPPSPSLWDGYYYYTDHMDKIQVPLICFLADSEGDFLDLVDADQVIRDLVNGKTQTSNDEVHFIESAHIDIPVGLRNPYDMFPQLATWLAKI